MKEFKFRVKVNAHVNPAVQGDIVWDEIRGILDRFLAEGLKKRSKKGQQGNVVIEKIEMG